MNKHITLLIKPLLITACLLGLLSPLNANELGRFFTTPEDRAMLDNMREAAANPVIVQDEPEPEPVVEEYVEPVLEPEEEVEIPGITVNGVVYRQDGNSTAWLNGENTLEGDLESQYLSVDGSAIKGQNVPVQIKINKRELLLKPGQTYQPEVDHVMDVYKQQKPERASDEG